MRTAQYIVHSVSVIKNEVMHKKSLTIPGEADICRQRKSVRGTVMTALATHHQCHELIAQPAERDRCTDGWRGHRIDVQRTVLSHCPRPRRVCRRSGSLGARGEQQSVLWSPSSTSYACRRVRKRARERWPVAVWFKFVRCTRRARSRDASENVPHVVKLPNFCDKG